MYSKKDAVSVLKNPVTEGTKIGAEALFRLHAPFVAAFLRRLGVPAADIDDLVQEVFLVVHRKGGYEVGPAQPRSWLGAIAVRVASTRRRSQNRRRENLDESAFDLAADLAAGPEDVMQARQRLGRVEAALSSLDEDHRGVFVLYELEGESCQAIAHAFDVPVGTIYSRLHNARRRFMDAHEAMLRKESRRLGSAPPPKTGSQ